MNTSLKHLLPLVSAALLLVPNARGATGGLDTSFNPGAGANDEVNATAVQNDGKVIIGGAFTAYNGVARKRIARLTSSGALDGTFNVGNGANDIVTSIALLPDGKIIIAGSFTTVDNYICNRIARLHPNGAVDTAFNPGDPFDLTRGATGSIFTIAMQSDGKILIAGIFDKYRNVTRNSIARLNSDGTLDPTFDPGAGPDSNIYAVIVAADGKILIGGQFNSFNGVQRQEVARLNANGSVDLSFNPGSGTSDNGAVNAITYQPDGKIVIVGSFSSFNGTPAGRVVRLNPNGSRDASFATAFGQGGTAKTVAMEANGKILVGGRFGEGIPALTRLNPDGSFDPSFRPKAGPNDFVNTLSFAPGARIVIGGLFTSYDGLPRARVARVIGYTAPALRNISTRVGVQTGDRVAIAGFIISGTGTKEVLLRGIGPSLAAQGVPNALQDPVIELYNSSGELINSNNNWRDTQQNVIAETAIQPSDDRESALLINLGTGSYTVVLKGVSDTTGNGLIELYDLTGGTAAKLPNISTRGFVGTGDNVMIGGFILEGDNARVVVRAIGPSLTSAGVSGALADPRVALYTGNGDLVGFNRDWQDGQGPEIAATGLQPSNNLEAALIVTLQAGNYTAVVEGTDETSGVGLVEVYHVQ